MNNGPEDIEFEQEGGLPPQTIAAQPLTGAVEGDPHLEAALQQALQPEHPPADFADRVLARALAGERPTLSTPGEAQPAGKLLHLPDRRLWISGLIAAALVAGIFEGGVAMRRMREQQRRIVQATQQFQTTERVTVHALAQAREQLQRAGVPLSLD